MAMQETYESPKRDNLFSATGKVYAVPDMMTVTVEAKRGTLLTAAGAKATGASDIYAVLAEDVEAGKVAPVYLTGEFNSVALAEATGIEITDAIKQACRKLGIFVRTNIEA